MLLRSLKVMFCNGDQRIGSTLRGIDIANASESTTVKKNQI
jgi:hypothetical protein